MRHPYHVKDLCDIKEIAPDSLYYVERNTWSTDYEDAMLLKYRDALLLLDNESKQFRGKEIALVPIMVNNRVKKVQKINFQY